jgi:DNA-binding NarL/FixJ family response regulator
MDPRLANALGQDVIAKTGAKARRKRPLNILSDPELQVLRLLAQCYRSQQIAKQILVGVETVELFLAHLPPGTCGLKKTWWISFSTPVRKG